MSSDISSGYVWQTVDPMPTKRVFSTPVEAGGLLYVLGGCDAKGLPLNDFQVYNPNASKKNRWKGLPNMPTKRAGTTAVAIGNKIIAMGGVSTKQIPLDVVEIFDIEKNEWTTGDPMKEALMGVSAVAMGGRVYVTGGMSTDTNPKNYFMSYNADTNKWASHSCMPSARYATFSFLIGDKFYVLGGRQGKLPCDACEVYDFSSEKWRSLPCIPSKRVFAMYVASDTHLFSLGGLNQNAHKDGFSDVLEVFDLEKEEWSTRTSMLNKRGDFAAAVLGGNVVAAGGLSNEGKPLSEAEVYDLTADVWRPLTPMAHPHCSCAYTIYNEKLHIIGGLSTGGATNIVDTVHH